VPKTGQSRDTAEKGGGSRGVKEKRNEGKGRNNFFLEISLRKNKCKQYSLCNHWRSTHLEMSARLVTSNSQHWGNWARRLTAFNQQQTSWVNLFLTSSSCCKESPHFDQEGKKEETPISITRSTICVGELTWRKKKTKKNHSLCFLCFFERPIARLSLCACQVVQD
jgi:hypothetical protein